MKTRQSGGARPRQPLVRLQLDPVIWQALQEIAAQQARSVRELVAEIARDSLHLAIHVYIDEFYRAEGTDAPEPERC